MQNKNMKANQIVRAGSTLIVALCLFQFIFPTIRFFMVLLVFSLLLYLYVHADIFSGKHIGSSKWKTYRYLTIFGLLCFLSYYVYMYFQPTSPSNSFMQYILPVFIAVFGNLAPKIPFNRTLGLRLPWTVADESVWRYAHRMVGYCTIPVVLLMMIGLLVHEEGFYSIALLAWILIPSITSYLYDRKRDMK